MRYFQFFAADYKTGATLPNATVSVYQTGTTTPVALYDKTGSPISNPVTASDLGLVSFSVGNGTYDIAITALGGQSKPTMQGVQIVDEAALASELVTPSGVKTPVSAPSMGAQIDSASTGGGVAAGTYSAVVTYNGSTGETTASTSLNSVTVTGSTNILYVFPNDAPAGAKSFNTYIKTGSGSYYLAASSVSFGKPAVITTTPPTSGTQPPSSNTAVSTLSQPQYALAGGPGVIVIPATAEAGNPGDPVAGQTIIDTRTGALSSVTDSNAKTILTGVLSALSGCGLLTNSTT